MRVSQRLDHAVTALVLLARRPPGACTPARELARELGLPVRFVEQQFTELARAGIVDCRRGKHGGCMLAQPAERITLADVAGALQGEVIDVPAQPGSAVAEAWARVATQVREAFSVVDIRTLAARQDEIDHEARGMYYI